MVLHLRASLVEMRFFPQMREQGAEVVCRCVGRQPLRELQHQELEPASDVPLIKDRDPGLSCPGMERLALCQGLPRVAQTCLHDDMRRKTVGASVRVCVCVQLLHPGVNSPQR